jgi:hypothetical protein
VKTDVQSHDVQTQGEGAGPMYHRVYAIDVPVPYDQALKTMKKMMADPNPFSPKMIATFEKTKGRAGRLEKGDEFIVHITGPWQGPVRVSQVGESSFTLLTLNGHIEAGQIQFRLVRCENGTARFEIESLTRSKDQIVNLFYDKLRLAQFAQTEMWELFCKEFAARSLGPSASKDRVPEVKVKTERQDRETGEWTDVSGQIGSKGIS